MDAVVISLPPFAHSDEVQVCAERNIHIFIEKPIALNIGLARKMAEAVKKHKVKSQVDFEYRFLFQIERLQEMIRKNQTGKICSFMGKYSCNALHTPWWREKERSGGQLTEQAIHLVDLCHSLLGEPDSIFSVMDNLAHKDIERFTSEDTGATIIRFKNGAIATISVTDVALPDRWDMDFRFVSEFVTADMKLLYDRKESIFYYTKEKGWKGDEMAWEEIKEDRNLTLLCLKDFIDAVRENRETRIPIDEGVKDLEITLLANKSAKEGRVVKYGEI